MITKEQIIIRKQLSQVYETAQALERQHEFIPGYKPAIVTKTPDGTTTVQRTAVINGKEMKWISSVEFEQGRTIRFKQIEGRLKGMLIEWLFEEVPEGTRLTITHNLHLNIPLIGWLAERLIAKPSIDRLTANVLHGLKDKMERA